MITREWNTLQVEQTGRVATVTLNRPDRLNAYTAEMRDELLAVLDCIDADDGIGALILTGAGRAFCAGADIKESSGHSFEHIRPGATFGDGVPRDGPGLITLRMFELNKPIIAAINGVAVGAGATIPLAADIRIGAASARIKFAFAQLGITPEGASTWFLPRLVGSQTALDWMLSARMIEAEEATRTGYFLDCFEPSTLMDQAMAFAQSYAEGAPVSVALTRRLVWAGLTHEHPAKTHRADSLALQHTAHSEDAREGGLALREKRAPVFKGRVSEAFPHAIFKDEL